MAYRVWLIRIRSDFDAELLREWLTDEAAIDGLERNTHLLRVCKRADGSVWAIVDSYQTGDIRSVFEYGYPAEHVLPLDEMLESEWDSPTSPLGRMEDGLSSAYLDAREDEFFAGGSPDLQAQYGLDKVFITEDLETTERVFEVVQAVAEKHMPRVLPRVDSLMFTVNEEGARLLGVRVERLSALMVEECRRNLPELRLLSPSELPKNTLPGSVQLNSNTAAVWENERFREIPLIGAKVSDDELVRMAARNAHRAHFWAAEEVVSLLGFERGPDSEKNNRRKSAWIKRTPHGDKTIETSVEFVTEEVDGRADGIDRFIRIVMRGVDFLGSNCVETVVINPLEFEDSLELFTARALNPSAIELFLP